MLIDDRELDAYLAKFPVPVDHVEELLGLHRAGVIGNCQMRDRLPWGLPHPLEGCDCKPAIN